MKIDLIVGIILGVICLAVAVWGFWFENFSGKDEEQEVINNNVESDQFEEDFEDSQIETEKDKDKDEPI